MTGEMHGARNGACVEQSRNLSPGGSAATDDENVRPRVASAGAADGATTFGCGYGCDAAGVDDEQMHAVRRRRRIGLVKAKPLQEGADGLRIVLVDLAAYGFDNETWHRRYPDNSDSNIMLCGGLQPLA